MDWLTAEESEEGINTLLATLWLDTHLLVAYLLSLVRHNVRERRLRVDWATEYDMTTMHFLYYITLDLNNWSISV